MNLDMESGAEARAPSARAASRAPLVAKPLECLPAALRLLRQAAVYRRLGFIFIEQFRKERVALEEGPHPQNSNRTSANRRPSSASTRCSSAASRAAKVTLKRRYAPASSHGTVEIRRSVISHCYTSSADANSMRGP